MSFIIPLLAAAPSYILEFIGGILKIGYYYGFYWSFYLLIVLSLLSLSILPTPYPITPPPLAYFKE